MALKQDVDWLGDSVAELVAPALLLLTALGVLAVTQPVYTQRDTVRTQQDS